MTDKMRRDSLSHPKVCRSQAEPREPVGRAPWCRRGVIATLLWPLLAILLLVPPAAAQPGNADETPAIHLRAATFDPLAQSSENEVSEGPAGRQADLYLVQFKSPVRKAWKDQVTATGAELFDYVPDNAFVARMTPLQAEQVAALAQVRWVGAYEPAYRLEPSLARQPDSAPAAAEPIDVRISVLPGGMAAARSAVEAVGGAILGSGETALGGTLRVAVAPAAVPDLARSPAIRWIEPAPRRRLLNNVARHAAIMAVEPVWDVGLFGAGQIVALADSGLDVGNMDDLSADFSGRVVAVHPLGESKETWNDPFGHGTHVAGSIAGSGALSGSRPEDHAYDGSLAGVAPEASLVVQAFDVDPITGEISGVPDNLNALFQPAYDDGARVHSNSWGADDLDPDNPYGGYPIDAREVDEFVWSHPDMTILFAAGNSGTDILPETETWPPGDGIVDPDSVTPPGTAKNVLTVGATESFRPAGGGGLSAAPWGLISLLGGLLQDPPQNVFLREPISKDLVSNNPQGMAAFSSRGPTDDGRIKPDLVAPGTNIVSARSHDPGFRPLLTSWGPYWLNPHYVFNGGTSMATPLAAGSAVLTRQWYVEQGVTAPSAALIKATLLNGAEDQTPGQYGTGTTQEVPPRPNSVEGWGRVDLARSLLTTAARRIWFDDHTSGLETEDRVMYTGDEFALNVVSSTPLEITLAWTDYPGSPAAAENLVNDLDLTVLGPGGQLWYGNGVDGDRVNNVETVDIQRPPRGAYRILVTAHNVPQGPQPYALVVAGAVNTTAASATYIPIIRK